jgi:predicted nucleic acid-binding protein
VYAGLARALRENPPRLSGTGYEDAKSQFAQLWEEIIPIAVSSELIQKASHIAEEYELRAYDALQFTTTLHVATDDLILATTDRDLEKAARTANIPLSMLSSSEGRR